MPACGRPSMPVLVVQVGMVGMAVGQCRVLMGMHMRLTAIPDKIMGVLMVGVMPVRVAVGHGFMHMGMRVALTQVQPQAQAHQA